MTTYKILSDNTTLGKPGSTVSETDLAGLNIAALVAGGHIEPASISAKRQDKKEQE
jgi:hypothetical protein